MKIKVEKFGIIHGIAFCEKCDWSEAINTAELNRMQKLRNKVYKHIKETWHSVIIETGTSTRYEAV